MNQSLLITIWQSITIKLATFFLDGLLSTIDIINRRFISIVIDENRLSDYRLTTPGFNKHKQHDTFEKPSSLVI